MNIVGFQKLSLLDFPKKTACIIWTAGCNLNCVYCQNSSLINPVSTAIKVSEDEVIEYLQKRKGLIDGICISGGEPLLQKDLQSFLLRVKKMGFLIKLDTNGTLPDLLKQVVDKKLVDYVAMDLKCDEHCFEQTCGLKDFDYSKVEKSVDVLANSGIDFELRTTFAKPLHNSATLINMSNLIKKAKVYYIQNFRDCEGVLNKSLSSFNQQELEELLSIAKNINQNTYLR